MLPCESGKVIGTRPREHGAFPVIRHFIWRNQTNKDAVKCRWAETRLFGANIPVWMYRPRKRVTKEPSFSNLGVISFRSPAAVIGPKPPPGLSLEYKAGVCAIHAIPCHRRKESSRLFCTRGDATWREGTYATGRTVGGRSLEGPPRS